MYTVENKRIRVTVTDEVYNRFAAKVPEEGQERWMPSGDTRIETKEAIVRGRILSEAMAKLGNQSELSMMEQEQHERSLTQVLETVKQNLKDLKNMLMLDYWHENPIYSPSEISMRYMGGHRMSAGMEHEAEKARAEAQRLIKEGGLLEERKQTEIAEYILLAIKQAASMGVDVPEWLDSPAGAKHPLSKEAINQESSKIVKLLKQSILADFTLNGYEKSYRASRSNMTGWKIEVIGDMPEIIGMCRYA